MTENIRPEDSSSLATIEDIQKRLVRPTSLHSPSEGLSSSQLKLNLKQSGTVKKKLEDYLDPILLSAVSSKIRHSKEAKTETKFKREVKGFEWPADELKVLVGMDSRNSNRGNWRNKAIDLNNDFDVIGSSGGGDEEIGSPLQRFKFKH